MAALDKQTEAQLAVLREVAGLLKTAGMRFWLRGGWALDFHLGHVSRAHGDIDLLTWKRNRGRVCRLLATQGFVEVRKTTSNLWFHKHGVEVAVDFIVRGRDGAIYVAGFEDGEPLYLTDASLAGKPLTLQDISCRVVSVQGLIRQLERAPAWLGRRMRPKDVESLSMLMSLRESE